MRVLKRFAPTTRERAALTRIYGPEENWLGVTTVEAIKRRTIKRKEKRNGAA